MTLQDLMGGLEGLRSDFREDNALLREEMNKRHDINDKEVEALNTKVAVQNGRIFRLEQSRLTKEHNGWRWFCGQPWFPWLVVIVVVEIGPKALPGVFSAIASVFSHSN